ncbi:Fe-S protein, homolog of lactate dehydrogenase SO1521 [hydrothermal vent metagenome]|uniref:D-lactate dehydrogenase (cytochrome) n=1 Tax=hydrothermal vent metagenome TaxID=652676 RepID=A0A3B1D177_9ZZZZ
MIDQTHGDNWKSELKRKLGSKVHWDVVTLQLYSTAACFYEISPLAVIVPETVEDIVDVINICRKYKVPVLPRGAGSSLTGNSVAEAVILDLTKNFTNIKILNDNKVKSDVGVILNNLQDKLKEQNKKFAPDPSSGNVCVIGGMLGNNSGGPHTLKHGNMYKHVDEVSVVLSNGKIFKAKNILLDDIDKLDDFHRPYYEKIKSLLEHYASSIDKNRTFTTKSASGYQVWDILTDTHLNMASLMVGSEGTLGVFTEAVLKIIPKSPKRGVISFYFEEIEKMGIAVQRLRKLGASAIEFVDHSFIELALDFKPELKKFLPRHVRYLLYVEFEGDSEEEIDSKFSESIEAIVNEENLAEVGAYSTDEEEIINIFKIRKAATIILNKMPNNQKPIPFVEDASIHPDLFPKFLTDVSKLLTKYSFKYVVYGHAGNGNLHLRPLLDFKNEATYQAAQEFMENFVQLVIDHNGSLTGEHGDGRLRTPYMSKRFPNLVPLFEEIKNLFDPDRIMNPDIIVPSKEYNWYDNLRYTPEYKYTATNSRIDGSNWLSEIEKCHGCGTCREYCPVFIATGEEEATARAKANILRGIVSGKADLTTINSEQFYKVMDYCLNCGQCLTECPTNVNIPGLAVLAKEKLHEHIPYKINEHVLQNGKVISQLASNVPSLTNTILTKSPIRNVMEYTIGVDSRRNMPKFSKKLNKRQTKKDNKKEVVLWTGCSAQFNDTEGELKNSIEIFEKLGYDVIMPEWKCCNIAKITYGNIKKALPDIHYNIEVLSPYAKRGIPIVFTSASCGYAFMHEYSQFIKGNNALDKIVNVSYDIYDFLYREYLNGSFENKLIPKDHKVVYHEPCHLKSQKNKYGPTDLLKIIPGMELLDIKDSCCGIAGTFGMKKENFDLSMEIGSKLFHEIKNAEPEIVLSGCGTCQIQISQGTKKEVFHPIVLINESFKL